MKKRCQRRALAACGDVAAAKIGYYVDTCQFGQKRGVVQLQGVARAVKHLRAVPQSLAVRADGLHLAGRYAAGLEQRVHHLCIRARQCVGSQRGAVQLVCAGGVQGKKLCS